MENRKADLQEYPESPHEAHDTGDTLEADKTSERVDKERERLAIRRAKDRARTARWDLNIAIFLFVVLIIVIIMLFQGIVLEIVAPVAVIGLGLVWLTGWRQGRQLFERFCEEELSKLEYERTLKVEETIEEAVRKAIRERLR
jgi:Flp pilus assembly protein TadB